MSDAEQIENEEEELIIVEDKSKLSKPEAQEEEHDDEDERLTKTEEESEDRELIRERRRKEKQDRKVRREEAIKRDKLELDFLRKRNDDLERRVTAQEHRAHAGDLSAIDTAIAQATHEVTLADQVIAKAIASGDGEDVTRAMRIRDQARERMQMLNAQKQNVRPPQQSQQIDERIKYYATEFVRENPWYDGNGRDEDSAIVLAIDQALAREGYDPKTEDYWQELRARAARRLPERFKTEEKEQRVPRGGPVVGSGKEHAPSSTRREVYISPERKQALIDANVWDDPVLRARYIKRYAEYDKANRA